MKIFVVCSVRGANKKTRNKLEYYAIFLESQGNTVHLPHRDTNQRARGIEICRQNMEAIKNSDEVHIFYDGESQGIHFDMGMAFSLGKKIKVIKNEPYGEGKSFPEMLVEWEYE